MLLFLGFLVQLIEMHIQVGMRIKAPCLVCNNQGPVKSVDKLTKYTKYFPNTTMEAEWDCLAQIVDTIKALWNAAPVIAHIKGHQDDNTLYNQLTLPAQLYCNADAHALACLQDNPEMDHRTSHLFPVGACAYNYNTAPSHRSQNTTTISIQDNPGLRMRGSWSIQHH